MNFRLFTNSESVGKGNDVESLDWRERLWSDFFGGEIASSARSHMANREEWTGLLPDGIEKVGKFECDSPFSPHKEKLFHAFEHTFQCSVFNLEVGS